MTIMFAVLSPLGLLVKEEGDLEGDGLTTLAVGPADGLVGPLVEPALVGLAVGAVEVVGFMVPVKVGGWLGLLVVAIVGLSVVSIVGLPLVVARVGLLVVAIVGLLVVAIVGLLLGVVIVGLLVVAIVGLLLGIELVGLWVPKILGLLLGFAVVGLLVGTIALGELLVLVDFMDFFNRRSSVAPVKRVTAETWSVNIMRRRRTDVVVAKIDFMIGADNKYLSDNNKRKEGEAEAEILTSEEVGGTGAVDYDWSGGHTFISHSSLVRRAKKTTVLCTLLGRGQPPVASTTRRQELHGRRT
jgi:hypothetical protein